MKKCRNDPRDSWDTDTEPNVCVMGVLVGTDSEGDGELIGRNNG